MKCKSLKCHACTTNKGKKLTMIATRIDQIRKRQEIAPVKNGRRGIDSWPRSRAFFGIAAVQMVQPHTQGLSFLQGR